MNIREFAALENDEAGGYKDTRSGLLVFVRIWTARYGPNAQMQHHEWLERIESLLGDDWRTEYDV